MLIMVTKLQHIADYLSLCTEFKSHILARIDERRAKPTYHSCPDKGSKTSKINTSRFSPEERTRRMKKGLWFNCATKGHMAKDCLMKTIQVKTVKKEKKKKEEEEDF
jgi:rRNA maturation protein Nop10